MIRHGFISLILIFAAQSGIAQDSTATVKGKKVLGAGIYYDYGKLLNSLADGYNKMEGGAELMFMDKLQLVVEAGRWNMSPSEIIENGDYHSEGDYFRLGIGYMPRVDPESRVGIGLRYARADFTLRGSYTFEPTDGLQGTSTEDFGPDNTTADWYEVVFYSDKKLNRFVTIGFTTRLRFGVVRQEFMPIDTQIIPGYGNPSGKRILAFNLFMKIPL